MLKVQQEQLSSMMDGEQCEPTFIDTILNQSELKQCWRRYHVAREVMQGRVEMDDYLMLDISDKIAQFIEVEELPEQPVTEPIIPLALSKLIWLKTKDVFAKLGQVGLAACVTLSVIGIVQYQYGSSNGEESPILNTVPVGINLAPVGGIVPKNNYEQQLDTMSDQQYNKIRLLVQDYELQRRLNVQ